MPDRVGVGLGGVVAGEVWPPDVVLPDGALGVTAPPDACVVEVDDGEVVVVADAAPLAGIPLFRAANHSCTDALAVRLALLRVTLDSGRAPRCGRPPASGRVPR